MYLPWVDKGSRKSNTLRHCVGTSASYTPRLQLFVVLSSGTVRRDDTITQPLSMDSLLALLTEDSDKHSGQRTTSPERDVPCEGWCRMVPMLGAPDHADVVGRV